MSPKTYSKINNLFQSNDWESFQESLGRKDISLGEFNGSILDLPLRQKFAWFQKGPERLSSELVKTLKTRDLAFVRIEPLEITAGDITKLNLVPVGSKSLLSGQASPKATIILDLTKVEEQLLTDMKSKTRYNIRLAEKKGVVVRESTDVDVFYQMLTATSGKNTGYFPHPKEYYQKMITELAPKNLAKIFLAEVEGEPLAAILVTFFGGTATYLHGGQGTDKRNLMAPYLCQWEAIRAAKARGCEEYDFWGVAETPDPKDPWAGITRFKEGFGGEKVIFPGSFDLVIRPFWYNVLTALAKIKHILR